MYNNFTFISNGELSIPLGIHKGNIAPITLSTYENLDNIRISAMQQSIPFVMDFFENFDNIVFDDFGPDEDSLISTISYMSNGVYAIINKKLSTAAAKKEDNSLRFNDPVTGHIAALHGMLRLLFNNIPPNDTILGHAHYLFTLILSNIIIKDFNKENAIINFPDEKLAALRYACACISATKHFELSASLNDVCIPLTTMSYDRTLVPTSFYQTNNNITTYEAFCVYLTERVGINIDLSTLVTSIMRKLSYRTIPILECGVDFMIDCILSKANTTLISRFLYNKYIGQQQYKNMQRKISQVYYFQRQLNNPSQNE